MVCNRAKSLTIKFSYSEISEEEFFFFFLPDRFSNIVALPGNRDLFMDAKTQKNRADLNLGESEYTIKCGSACK